ncbi:hypothetical protein L596_015866 [Steinernema carpocapsae]|uniref:Uncharacterized protein n=1 Tax=Steinernema carpocapsae TaxID=34508 RepID=A0A4U5NHB2_STECR|nr:hypothetical protein L596_015866 [Steinernema carpocapsae]
MDSDSGFGTSPSSSTSSPDANSSLSSIPTIEAAKLMNLVRNATDFQVINFALQEVHGLKLTNRQVERVGLIPFLVECARRQVVNQKTADTLFARFRRKENSIQKPKTKKTTKKQRAEAKEPEEAEPKKKIVLKIKLDRKESSTICRSIDGDNVYCSSSSFLDESG